jgi:uncharacterized protein
MDTPEFARGLDRDVGEQVSRLAAVVRAHGPMVVAYSGGVDSGLLAWVAHRVLGDDMRCVIGISPSLSRREERAAVEFLRRHGIPYQRLETREMEDERYRANGPDRCFFCKKELFERIESSELSQHFGRVAYGANVDDRSDHRPGSRAALEHGVVAPLTEAGMDKASVRRAARALGLDLWDKPAAPCLASRVPYHREVTPETLRQIEDAEGVLKDLGFIECRVRHHGDLARVELPRCDHARALESWDAVVNGILSAGFNRVELEPDGLRSGRLNDALVRGEA